MRCEVCGLPTKIGRSEARVMKHQVLRVRTCSKGHRMVTVELPTDKVALKELATPKQLSTTATDYL